jgi:sugar phosphate isomerase/epimerase
VHRWHELEQRWEDEDVPLPRTEAERRTEHGRLEAAEAAEGRERGRTLWEVRLELPSHDDARELARRLEDEGLSVIARWTYLLVGADNEDDARELAERLRAEAPNATVQVEPSGEMAAQVTPANPFAIFGGLAS